MGEFLYGRRPVYEALRAQRRICQRVVVARGAEEGGLLQEIRETALDRGIRVETAARDALTALVQGASHQGVLLECSSYRYASVDQLLGLAQERSEAPLILLLDLVQDVHNVGALLRTAEAVGVHGVILQERRAAGVTPAVVNASSGAVEHLLIAQEINLVRVMESLKTADIWMAGLDLGDDAIRYDRADLRGALGLVVGSEGKGLRRLVRRTCDFIIYLPMQGKIASLNASVAGSVALYAAWQARHFNGGS